MRISTLLIGGDALKELKIKSQYECVGSQVCQEKLMSTIRLSLLMPSNETEKNLIYLREEKERDTKL